MSLPFIDLHTHRQSETLSETDSALPVTSGQQAAAPDHLAGADVLAPGNPYHTPATEAYREILAVRSIRFTADTPDTLPYPGLCSAGIHPWDAAGTSSETAERLAAFCENEQVIMIGETGLDYTDSYKSSAGRQFELLELQIDLAESLGKPLIIHNVRALDDSYRLLRTSRVPVILHGFTGPAQAADQWLGALSTVCFSFGAGLLRSHKAQETLAYLWNIGLQDRIFFETDDSPHAIGEIYTFAADVLKTPPGYLREMTAAGFRYLFPQISV